MIVQKLVRPESEDEITSHWLYDDIIYVSCVCITYNHEDYISSTIDAMLAQISHYRFEIVIHDDKSNDRTQELIQSYKKQYPNIIRLVLQEENQYSMGKKITPIACSYAKGKYIALCEGDDFWCDERKIQKQCKFLEENEDYFVSCHDALIIDSMDSIISQSKLSNSRKRNYTKDELAKNECFLLTMSWMFRRLSFDEMAESEYDKVLNGDTFLVSIFGLHGKAKYHDDIKPAAYRAHESGVWSLIGEKRKINAVINTYYWLYIYHNRINSGYGSYYQRKHALLVMNNIVRDKLFISFSYYFIKYQFKAFIKRLFKNKNEN